MKLKAALFVIVSSCSFLHALPSRGDTILSNIPGTGTYVAGSFLGSPFSKAVGLTLGGTDMVFQSMDAILSNIAFPQQENFLGGGIYSSPGGNPGALLASFDVVFLPGGSDNVTVTFMTTTPFTLLAGTSYWFVLNDLLGGSVDWQRDSANTAPTATGVTWDGYRLTSNAGTSWTASSVNNSMAINAAPVPEPATWAMVCIGACLLAAFMRARRRAL